MENTNPLNVRRRGRPLGQFEKKTSQLLELIKNEPNLKIAGAAQLMGVTPRQVCRYLAELRKKGLVPETRRFRADGEWVSVREVNSEVA